MGCGCSSWRRFVDEPGVIATVATAFGVRQQQGETMAGSVVSWLHTRRALLVLDNCEHVLGPVRDLVAQINARCPGVSVLATSREALGPPAATSEAIPWPLLQWYTAYGVACFVIGLIVLRYRRLAIV